jgi:hypothetical protein
MTLKWLVCCCLVLKQDQSEAKISLSGLGKESERSEKIRAKRERHCLNFEQSIRAKRKHRCLELDKVQSEARLF